MPVNREASSLVDGRSLDRVFYPPCCILCGGTGHGRDLCDGCERDLPWNEPACPRCALPVADGTSCGACLTQPPRWDGAFGLLRYRYPADALVKALKYGHRLAVGRMLGDLMAERLADRVSGSGRRPPAPLPGLIVAVPLHAARECERGFNQAAELARRVAAGLGVTLARDICRRVRDTPAQSGLDRRARRRNLRQAFVVRHPPGADHVAIVDDVVTTGATASALAMALRRAGVHRVEVWCAARAVR